jgi:hypothetical protein
MAVFLKNDLHAEGNLKNLPGEGSWNFTYAASPQGPKGKMGIAFRRPQNFLHWLGMKADAIPSELREAFTFSTQYIFGDKLHLQNMNLALKDAKVLGDISWQTQGGNPLIYVDLESPKIENVLKLMAISTPFSGVSKLKGTLAGDMNKL